MADRETVWGIVLASGDAAPLRPVMTDVYGVDIPSQFCAFNGHEPLFRQAVRRATRLTSRTRVVTVVATQHRRWWAGQLDGVPAENVIVQPCNRGTACSVLLPLIHVLLLDPGALVVALPAGHFVADDEAVTRTVRRASRIVRRSPQSIVLLGITPDAPDHELGWIEPTVRSVGGLHWVLSVVEKPMPEVAEHLRSRGAFWNSSILVAKGLTLLAAFNGAFPELVKRFGAAWLDHDRGSLQERMTALFSALPSLDLSRDVLTSSGNSLRVLPVPPCGWSDLGTPERVKRCLERLETAPSSSRGVTSRATGELPDLAIGVSTFLLRHPRGIGMEASESRPLWSLPGP